MDNSEQKIVSAYHDYLVHNNYLGQAARRSGLTKGELFKAIIKNGLLFKSKIVETEPSRFFNGDQYIDLEENLDYRDTYVGVKIIELLNTGCSLDELRESIKDFLLEREMYYEDFNHVIWRNSYKI